MCTIQKSEQVDRKSSSFYEKGHTYREIAKRLEVSFRDIQMCKDDKGSNQDCRPQNRGGSFRLQNKFQKSPH